ncbi:unnamed protein product [Nyctereutes procyonoides]|uniref:(raccoon dog) hypothetical protein n=1 Tax=Nyctereutes procyonoides TaxID=34880 RepID=A0A811Z3V0_NYCPR|nr:unnamed protein product [Nyctereutes procyonoides]
MKTAQALKIVRAELKTQLRNLRSLETLTFRLCVLSQGAGSGGPGGLTSAAPAGGDREVIATKVLGTVKWFNVRDGHGLINRNDTKEDVFVHQTAIKKNDPRKCLRGVGDGDTVELDVVEGEEGAEAASVTGPGALVPWCLVPWWSPSAGRTYAADRQHHRRCPRRRGPARNYQQDYQHSESGDKIEGSESAPEGQAQQRRPYRRRRLPPDYLRGPCGTLRDPGGPCGTLRAAATTVFQPPCAGRRDGRGPPRQRQPREDGKEEDKENQGDETQGQQPPQRRRYRRSFSYPRRRPENPKPQEGKETKAADPPAENWSAPRLSRAGLSKCRLTASTIGRFSHPTRRSEDEIPAIRNEQKMGAEDLKCLLFAH